MSLDETVIYELMEAINQLKREIKNLKDEMKELGKDVRANTFELSKNN